MRGQPQFSEIPSLLEHPAPFTAVEQTALDWGVRSPPQTRAWSLGRPRPRELTLKSAPAALGGAGGGSGGFGVRPSPSPVS